MCDHCGTVTAALSLRTRERAALATSCDCTCHTAAVQLLATIKKPKPS